MSELQRKNDFTTGPIFGPLVKFTLPILGALILQSLYGAVDLMIVGKFAASADVSAVSMGTTVLMGQFLGAKRREECGEIIGTAVCFFAVGNTVFDRISNHYMYHLFPDFEKEG